MIQRKAQYKPDVKAKSAAPAAQTNDSKGKAQSPSAAAGLNHLWQGEWISDKELDKKIKDLRRTVDDALAKPLEIQAVLDACQCLSDALHDHNGKVYKGLAGCLLDDFGIDPAQVKKDLSDLADFMQKTSLEDKVLRELKTRDPFFFSRPEYRTNIFERWAPLGFLVHVAPTNAYSVGAYSVIEGLLTGNINFLKTGGSDPPFAQLFLKSLIDLDRTHTLAAKIFVCKISSKQQNMLRDILSHADGIAAWGNEGALEGLRAMAPAFARFVDWGPKISFAYFAADSLSDKEAIEEVAKEICLLEQQACSSPQCVYVETGSREELLSFAKRLARALDKISPTIPAKQPGLHEQAEITSVVELCRLESYLDLSEVIEATDKSWRVLVEHASSLRASPLYRSVWVKPIQRGKIIQTLRPLRAYLQTTGLVCKLASLSQISDALIQAGVLRITRAGGMLDSYDGEPHDGVYALQRYSKRISAQLGSDVAGICSFAELQASALQPPDAEILTKEGFQASAVDPKHSHLFFKSGGSSGAPKLSVFSHDDYHLQMSAAADGLFAAGLDPATDRCMNLFFGGGLYGGFISFFTILENLKAIQYPMGAHPDTTMVAQTIVGQSANVLLGMPSYLIQLFGQNADFFRKNKVVEKIFYGGEHFNEIQKNYIQKEFGVKVIRSATYGSVDAGPIGFQCSYCETGVHHLHSRLHILEILDLEKDAPVKEGELGRVVLTSLARAGQKLERYEIGDLARLVPGPCQCGRQAARFELLGRHGDVFRLASMFFNYAKISNILTDYCEYAGEMQLKLRSGEKTEKDELWVLVSNQSFSKEETVRDIILQHYEDIRECVLEDKLLDLRVALINPSEFLRTPGSGKLRRVVDERIFSRKA
jgi:phenylacetate-coenzyme A ligase PaaK-like adenylate-forming protein/acyl-CoA reductase-like NAD-dependent aldehyde dehydrogenase